MKINIFGSTGIIGDKSLKLISKLFPKIVINLLVANNNYNKLIKQCNLYSPKYVCIKNSIYINKIKNNINNKIKIIEYKDLNIFLKTKKTEITILSISGYQALDYFESILKNTKFLGLVNKETIVSIGHLFKNNNFKKNTIFFPLDSEHFSLFDFFSNNKTDLNKVKKIYLTASGGPFLNYNIKQLKKVKFGQAIKHPKWKMGYKNSIDSATLANKCLELIEAHYLFNIPYEKLDILIHPESLIHSIIEYNNGTSIFVYFYNDMDILIINFLSMANNKKIKMQSKFSLSKNLNLNFSPPDEKLFPIYNIYKKMNKKSVIKKVMFNVINENAVELFIHGKIKFTDISQYVDKYLSLDLKMPLSNVKNVIKFHKIIKRKLDLLK